MLGNHRLHGAKLSLLIAASAIVCLAQMPPSNSSQYAAKVVTATGRVSVLKDSQPWALDVGDMVQVQQLIVTGPDGHATFQISDGSTFEVYPNSQVVFRKNTPNWLDLIDVMLGRVRVHIEHWGNQPNPNRVITPTAVISVRGTTFDVSVEEDEQTTLVEVEDGQVEVQHALLPRGNPKVLGPGESLRVYKSEPLASNVIDKGTIWRHAVRMIIDAATTYGSRTPRVGGGGPVSVGDTKGPPPPPTTPPPPLPPLPPPPLH